MPENLWPVRFAEPAVEPPVAILRQQGAALGERTQNIVVGRLSALSADSGKFRYTLSLYCAPLGFQLPLLSIEHHIDLYPPTVIIDGEDGSLQAASPEEFKERLKEIFARPRTVKTVASLMAQSRQ